MVAVTSPGVGAGVAVCVSVCECECVCGSGRSIDQAALEPEGSTVLVDFVLLDANGGQDEFVQPTWRV